MEKLHITIDRGFRNSAHLLADGDLASLHSAPNWSRLVEHVRAKEAEWKRGLNAELYEIFQNDQSDRTALSQIDWSVVSPRDGQRRRRVQEILDSGGAKVSADFFHAAMVFQHGAKVADYQQAHSLALKAVELDADNKTARWLAAASRDRGLMTEG